MLASMIQALVDLIDSRGVVADILETKILLVYGILICFNLSSMVPMKGVAARDNAPEPVGRALTRVRARVDLETKFMPHSIMDRLRDLLTRLEYGSMLVLEYVTHFHELSKHATMILTTKKEIIWRFVREVGMVINLKGRQLGTFRRPVQASHQIQVRVDQIVFHLYLKVIEFALSMAMLDTMLDIDPSIDFYRLPVDNDLRLMPNSIIVVSLKVSTPVGDSLIVDQALRDQRLYVKFSKCEFFLEFRAFLGNVVFKYVIMVDPTKIESILRLADYYGFIKGFSFIAAQLTSWLCSDAVEPCYRICIKATYGV
ncbi:hypothetical protein MTR67_030944 [Solanum verrucosum]|uniref:Uncharacterized protein n=1 Tax=Solanum verrucosum TaxID=315347 RepID=A0AAF0U1J7_SOLVR|nr:hypothetical protein MTR67_030944 [Solanum verrucosum]